MTIDNNIKETQDRSHFFQTVQVWPRNVKLNYNGWLANFKDENEKKIACCILDFFVYYSADLVDQMLTTTVGRAGYELSKFFPDWVHEDFKSKCFYSYIPGENPNPTDSGNLFARKLRDVLHIPEDRIVNYDRVYQILEDSISPVPVIFVDDFVGSGCQCIKAWCENRGGNRRKTLQLLAEECGHKVVYSPLIVNQVGFQNIQNCCPQLIISTAHVLGPEYNLFNKECKCWRNDESLFNEGIELILNKSKELGIPSTDGRSVNDEKGFYKQGLALAFEHCMPDAVPAFFYWSTDNWTPLIPKEYNR